MSGRAFVETTILANLLLKSDETRTSAANLIRQFDEVIVPQFAWKELKRGALTYFVWAHNRLTDCKTFSGFMGILSKLSRTPQRYRTSTTLEALESAIEKVFAVSPTSFAESYGEAASVDSISKDIIRICLKETIVSAWDQRNNLFGGPRHRLECYPDAELKERRNGHLACQPRDCPKGTDCCLRVQTRPKEKQIAALKDAIGESERREDSRRRSVLRQLEKHPNLSMTEIQCWWLGDAYFVLFCPEGATILTTNVRDLEPLAAAVGIAVASPP